MKVGVIGAGTMGQGIAKAFAQVEGYTVALCDIKQEWAEGGKDKIAKGYAKLVEKGKMTQEQVDGILNSITPGLKEDLCADLLIGLIENYKCTIFNTVPTMYLAIAQSPKFKPERLSSLRVSVLGGSITTEAQMTTLKVSCY